MPQNVVTAPVPHKRKLLDQVRDTIRRKHFSVRTEQSYTEWIRRFIIYSCAIVSMSRFLKLAGKSFVEWRPLSPRNPIHTEKPPANAIMQTFLLLLAMSEPSPLTLMITGAISLGSLTIFLHHKLG